MSNSNQLKKLCAATVLVLATPTLASAQSVAYGTNSPVVITSVNLNDSIAPAGNIEEPPQLVTNGLTLRFTNTNNVAASSVTFVVKDGAATQTIVDKGLFTPNVPIKHDFGWAGGTSTSDLTGSVTEVDFTDGTVWRPTAGGGAAQ